MILKTHNFPITFIPFSNKNTFMWVGLLHGQQMALTGAEPR